MDARHMLRLRARQHRRSCPGRAGTGALGRASTLRRRDGSPGRGLWWSPDGPSETGGNALNDLSHKVAVVTGGAAGIGRGITEALLEEGARVVIADVEEAVLEIAVKELADAGPVRGVVTDVSSAEAVEALAVDVFAREGACNLLFNNA